MKQLAIKTLAAALLATVATFPASATSISLSPDGLWHTFDVDNSQSLSGGLEWIDAQNAPGYNYDYSALDFTFTIGSAGYFTIIDGGYAGDQFQIFDNGNAIGYTSAVANNSQAFTGTNFDAAMLNPQFSKATFFLTAGSHDITGLLSISAVDGQNNPFNATVGAVSLAVVPEPEILEMLLVGCGLLGAYSRRRNK